MGRIAGCGACPENTPQNVPCDLVTSSWQCGLVLGWGQLYLQVPGSTGTNMAADCTRHNPPVKDPCRCLWKRTLQRWASMKLTSQSDLCFLGEDHSSLNTLSHRVWSSMYNSGLGPETRPRDSSTWVQGSSENAPGLPATYVNRKGNFLASRLYRPLHSSWGYGWALASVHTVFISYCCCSKLPQALRLKST